MEIPTVSLLSGHDFPVIGMGTFPLKGEDCKRAVRLALDVGYTHFDTAVYYENHVPLGEAIWESGVDRSTLFITSKIWYDNLQYDALHRQAQEILSDLDLGYIDLLLTHWPHPEVPMEETFRALGEVQTAGHARSIGVSNFDVPHMAEVVSVSEVPISVNQIKYHPLHQQREVLDWCLANQVVVTAYTPLGKKETLESPILVEIAEKHGKTSAQAALRWLLQKGLVVIPKASSVDHLRQNLDILDWELTSEDTDQIDQMSPTE